MWNSRTKTDLIIEVWEKLDCESVGAREIAAIETAVEAHFGNSAVDSPMTIARLLADEGAELRHSEIMELHVARFNDQPYAAEFRNIIDVSTFEKAESTIKRAENLRRKFAAENDREGLRLLRELVIKTKDDLTKARGDRMEIPGDSQIRSEIAEWLTIWLQSPEIFEQWIQIRRRSSDFNQRFEKTDGEATKEEIAF